MDCSPPDSSVHGVPLYPARYLPLSPFKDEPLVNHEKSVLLKDISKHHHGESDSDPSALNNHEGHQIVGGEYQG